ncbi:uncharacterized protein EI90DRAFT_3071831 [Cantharellus anzutake]|uniref:uncharacterized protein n=1 Tax=Cantharellus anzutake TaxID=1750568 RepID=UPI001902E9E1|nr:uncharacterized protein EI90DRAFT_3071831 [Cantharellus anzutake]KAF8325819.1 hypothetical protein EI90DRAFT_3071831 [Cantharellus anzutake]
MTAQYSPSTPIRCSSSSTPSSPLPSSPLNPFYRQHNPPSQRRPSLKSGYQTRLSGPTLSGVPEDPQKALWREKLRQQFLQRTERDRQKYRESKRTSSTQRSCDDATFGAAMDEMDSDEIDPDDYEMYRLMNINERRREEHALRAQFARTVGSSLDPNMDNFEEIERFLTGPPPIELEEQFPASRFEPIPSEFDIGDDEVSLVDPVAMDIAMDLSSPPASSPPNYDCSLPTKEEDTSFQSLILDCPCPFCNAPYALHFHDDAEKSNFECAVCNNGFLLASARLSWDSFHPNPSPAHTPVLIVDPALAEGVVALCSDDSCQWGCAFSIL